MSINYYPLERANPNNSSESAYYATARMKGYKSLDEVSEQIAAECTVTEHDVKAILSSLQQHIITQLQDNRSVRLGDLGSFHIRTNCYAVEDESELSTSNLKGVRVHFCKSARLLKEFNVNRCSFNRIDA